MAGNEEVAARDDLFAALVHRQSRFVFRVAFSVLRDPHDAEEVVHETFLRLYGASAWIAIDRRPKNRSLEAPVGLALNEPGPEAAVHRLIDALPEALRQPLALSTVDEMCSREIAEIMGTV